MTSRFHSTLAMAGAVIIPSVVLLVSPGWLLLVGVLALAVWMAFTRVGWQAGSITRLAMATLPQRIGAVSVVVVGIASVVGVLVSLLAMASGFEATLKRTGSADTAIVLQAGTQSEAISTLDHETAAIASHAQQVLRRADGEPIASAELVVVASFPKKGSGLDASVLIRGLGENAWELRPNVRIIAGRKFRPGLSEVVVGKGVFEQFADVEVGSKVNVNGQLWKVVGHFESGDANSSEIWGDAAVIGSAFRRMGSTTSLTVQLTGARAFEGFRAGLESDPRLKVSARTTRQYYSRQSEGLVRIIRILGTTVAAIMAVGAVLGALNTMYAAIATRTREIATLRAIGFRDETVIVSVLLETMLLAVLGGVLGAAISWAIFDGFTTSTAAANFSQIAFTFDVSQQVLWNGLKWALAIGLLGGLFPAVLAARMPVASGLREL